MRRASGRAIERRLLAFDPQTAEVTLSHQWAQAGGAISMPLEVAAGRFFVSASGDVGAAVLEVTETEQEIALVQYEQAIQAAFREVADTLAVQGTVDEQLAAQQSLVRATAETYRRLLELADTISDACQAVVVDATFLERGQRRRFRELARTRGQTIVTVTHDSEFAGKCDRIVELSDGRVV